MLSVRLSPETERRLGVLARRAGRTKSIFLLQIIENSLQDMENVQIAEARLAQRRKPLSSQQVYKELGLDD